MGKFYDVVITIEGIRHRFHVEAASRDLAILYAALEYAKEECDVYPGSKVSVTVN